VLSIEQVGLTVGIGLLLDTLIVRTFLMPSLVALLGRWFWWPRLPSRLPGRRLRVAHVPQDGAAGAQTSANWATRRVGSNRST
jgi:putative drug exporter of the RND superfamily